VFQFLGLLSNADNRVPPGTWIRCKHVLLGASFNESGTTKLSKPILLPLFLLLLLLLKPLDFFRDHNQFSELRMGFYNAPKDPFAVQCYYKSDFPTQATVRVTSMTKLIN
jgi:hypothetical protein